MLCDLSASFAPFVVRESINYKIVDRSEKVKWRLRVGRDVIAEWIYSILPGYLGVVLSLRVQNDKKMKTLNILLATCFGMMATTAEPGADFSTYQSETGLEPGAQHTLTFEDRSYDRDAGGYDVCYEAISAEWAQVECCLEKLSGYYDSRVDLYFDLISAFDAAAPPPPVAFEEARKFDPTLSTFMVAALMIWGAWILMYSFLKHSSGSSQLRHM